jgi:ketosteroid isomerase-like protein
MTSAAELAKALYEAYAAKDRDAAERLLDANFRFTSPIDNALSRQKYFEICWPNSESAEGFEFLNVAEAGDRVFVTYKGKRSGGKHFQNTEILTIKNGKISEVEVYFGWNIPHDVPMGAHKDLK